MVQVTQKELQANTSIPSLEFSKLVQADLEAHLFFEADGKSCGLISFYIETYRVTGQKDGLATAIEIETTVEGPVGECDGYSNYTCYTNLEKTDNTWKTIGTTCDADLQ